MGMAVATLNAKGSSKDNFDRRPIDLVHLAKQTLGDRSLEHEVLRLFLTQADVYMTRVEKADCKDDRFAAAHTIKGSARNIGAWTVADVAAHLEKAEGKEIPDDVAALRDALKETCIFIRSILDEN